MKSFEAKRNHAKDELINAEFEYNVLCARFKHETRFSLTKNNDHSKLETEVKDSKKRLEKRLYELKKIEMDEFDRILKSNMNKCIFCDNDDDIENYKPGYELKTTRCLIHNRLAFECIQEHLKSSNWDELIKKHNCLDNESYLNETSKLALNEDKDKFHYCLRDILKEMNVLYLPKWCYSVDSSLLDTDLFLKNICLRYSQGYIDRKSLISKN